MFIIAGHLRSSTRNCCIECLWVEVGSQYARRWRAFFTRLENLHGLDPGNPFHLWLLHTLFLNDVDRDGQTFRDEWNCHPISGPGTSNKSPKASGIVTRNIIVSHQSQDLRLLGQMRFGVYHEDSDQAEDDDDEAADVIASQQREYINHAAISIPTHRNPFDDHEAEVTFFTGLRKVVIQDITPDGFGLTPVEWPSDEYPPFETICVGRRKYVDISLADPVWFSRARLWCQAIHTLTFYLTNFGPL